MLRILQRCQCLSRTALYSDVEPTRCHLALVDDLTQASLKFIGETKRTILEVAAGYSHTVIKALGGCKEYLLMISARNSCKLSNRECRRSSRISSPCSLGRFPEELNFPEASFDGIYTDDKAAVPNTFPCSSCLQHYRCRVSAISHRPLIAIVLLCQRRAPAATCPAYARLLATDSGEANFSHGKALVYRAGTAGKLSSCTRGLGSQD